MADLYPFQDVPGLLSSQQQGNVRSNALMSAAAALLKSGAYQSTPVSPFAQLGQGLEGFLAGHKGGNDDALKQELLRDQIMARRLQMAKFGLEAHALGIDPSHYLGGAGGPTGAVPGLPLPGGPGGNPGMPSPPTTLVGNNPTMPPAPQGAGPGGGLPPGLFSPAPMATTPPPSLMKPPAPVPQPQPTVAAPALPNGAMSVLRGLPAADKALLLGSDKIGETVSKITSDAAKATPDMKNATASGKKDPFSYNTELKNAEKTPEQKAAEQAGFKDVPSYTGHLEAVKATGAAKGKRISDIIDAGGPHARATMANLNVMEDALVHGGDKIFTGPFAEEAAKLKQAYANMTGEKLDGLPETDVLSKLNAFLAGEATKQISSRPAQFEFQTYLKNNPGIATSIQGTKHLINIMRQTTQHNIKLGRLALNDKNVANWGDVEEGFYSDPKSAIISPFTGKALGTATGGGNEAPAAEQPPAGAPAGTKKAGDGNWYAPDPARAGKFLKVQ